MLNEVDISHKKLIFGLDKYTGMLKHSNQKTINIIQGDINFSPFKAQSFDGIFGSLADPYNTPNFYIEAFRMLKPNGSLLFSVPDFE